MLRIPRVACQFGFLNFRRCFSTAPTEAAFLERLEGDKEGIAVLNLNLPKTKNALSKNLLSLIEKYTEDIRFDKSVRALILKSSTENCFCAGADLKERKGMTQEETSVFVHKLRKTFSEFESLPIPTIAAINGPALGGGLELALCCDMRVAGPPSKIGLPEAKLAIIPGAGGTQRLARIIGLAKAKELIFTARVLDNKASEKIGLVNYAVDEDPYHKSLELAKEVLQCGPVAIRAAKTAIDQGFEIDRASGMILEQTCYAQVIPTKDRLEGLNAFANKRKPMYTGE